MYAVCADDDDDDDDKKFSVWRNVRSNESLMSNRQDSGSHLDCYSEQVRPDCEYDHI